MRDRHALACQSDHSESGSGGRTHQVVVLDREMLGSRVAGIVGHFHDESPLGRGEGMESGGVVGRRGSAPSPTHRSAATNRREFSGCTVRPLPHNLEAVPIG